ncbi:hypothetical protein XCCB100_3380 [Xanthomonas campestris pv. campestris]|uniref:Uncharacterized protein n=1 Tax=Xanthomonas campestris pv. campestris (strain B100) TaxID=509169 RepID=B0RTF6_XANCB|nr:hypothetical protein XCCB100_3380 [Xanthomonas campestris pv. campestris]
MSRRRLKLLEKLAGSGWTNVLPTLCYSRNRTPVHRVG